MFKDFQDSNGKFVMSRLRQFSGFSINKFLENAKEAITKEARERKIRKYHISLLGTLAYIGNLTQEEIINMAQNKANPKIYSGIFFNDGSHMTYHFNPNNPIMPMSVKDGDRATVEVVGSYLDSECSVDIVRWNGLTHSPFNGNVLHITRETKNISPYEAGGRASKGEIEYLDTPIELVGEWGFFRGGR